MQQEKHRKLEVHYRWQITEWGTLEMLKYPVWPAIIVDDKVLRETSDINSFLREHRLTFSQFLNRVPNGFVGTTSILS